MKQVRQALILLIVSLTALVVASACKRAERPLASSEARIGQVAQGDNGSVEPTLVTLPADSHLLAVAPKGADAPVDGAALFVANCSACHQVTGDGVPGAFPPLNGSAYVVSDNTERLVSIMLHGLQGPITVKGTTYAGMMTPFAAVLNDKEVAAVATYIRSSWTNSASAVAPETVEKMRVKWGQRGAFTISELGEEPGA